MNKHVKFKPSDVSHGHLWNSPWDNCEREMVASNILKLAHYNKDNEWQPFTWEEYLDFCSHGVSYVEQSILNEFVRDGYLLLEDDVYNFASKILGVYLQYLKEDDDGTT